MRPTRTSSRPSTSAGVGKTFRPGSSITSTPGNAARAARACSGVSGRSVSISMLAEWPTRTGTRTQVMLTARSGNAMTLRVSNSSFASSVE
jgi:hypothetical protein